MRDYDKYTPKERRAAHYLRVVPASNVLAERGENCFDCGHSYAEHKGKLDSRYMTACSRGECDCEGYIAPNEDDPAAHARDSDPHENVSSSIEKNCEGE